MSSPTPLAEHSQYPELLKSEIHTHRVVGLWDDLLNGEIGLGATDLICMEFWLSYGYPQMSHALPHRYTYSKTLLTLRQRVAISLHDYARSLNWRRPVTYVAALKVARAFLRDAVGHESAMREDLRRDFTGRLGVATLLISRFEPVSHREVREARLALLRSLDQGNNPKAALPYLVEAAVLEYDLEGDAERLKEAMEACASFGSDGDSAQLKLAMVDVNLRLMDEFDEPTRQMRRSEVERLLDDVARSALPEIKVRRAMARGLLAAQASGAPGASPVRGVKLPFGYRDEKSLHPALRAAAPYVYRLLLPLTTQGEPLATGVLADILTEAQGSLASEPQTSLTQAIELRDRLRGSDARADLLKYRDRATLAQLKKDKHGRQEALLGLAQLACRPLTAAPALVLLARNVESDGALPMPIVVGTPPVGERALRLVAAGDDTSLWSMAAEAALGDVNLTTVRLGGRSGVTTVGDYYGLSAETLVFKRRNRIAFERDSNRDEVVRRYLEANGLQDSFGVTVTLASCRPDESDGTEVVAARRFVPGTSLHEALSHECHERRVERLSEVARFLGLINLAEHAATASGARAEAKSKEMGRWLKRCGLDDPGATFDAWWSVMQLGMLVRRRDAHLGNWLLADDGRLIAIDLEAQGWRPAGYDLAQVTDDHSYLAIEDWESRRAIFEAYRGARRVADESLESEWAAYQAGVLARLVWGLTDPNDGPFESGVAERRLQGFVATAQNVQLSGIAAEILGAWLRRRGLRELPQRRSRTDSAGRVRLSRTMAYHLRHDKSLEMDEGGWTTLDDLADAIQQGTTPELLATVATDRLESRFEVRDGRIRARYGHSLEVRLDHLPVSRPLVVYHASPWAYTPSILDERRGLQRGGRRWVHLTDSMREAVANGTREGHPLVYAVWSDALPELLAASAHTFLAESVPSDALYVVPMSAYWDEIPTIETWLTPPDVET